MKSKTVSILAVITLPAFAAAQSINSESRVEVKPIASSKPLPVEAEETPPLSEETRLLLQERREIANRQAQIDAALALQTRKEAELMVNEILAEARADAEAQVRQRISIEEAGRTEQAREEAIAYMTRRLRGEVTLEEAPQSFRSRIEVRDPITGNIVVRKTEPRYYGENRRVITYRTRAEIPPILLASNRLDRVEVVEVGGSPFRADLAIIDDMPPAFIQPDAYAVTYNVDPASRIVRDDILFEQGTTNFADAYSYDLVADLAYAMRDSSLSNDAFVIEGHASAEGNYTENLPLSQARAERIVRELVRLGVPASRLVPVGYGEAEADYPADAAEPLRSTDRRVTVFRLSQ